jgi:hypothetical protein
MHGNAPVRLIFFIIFCVIELDVFPITDFQFACPGIKGEDFAFAGFCQGFKFLVIYGIPFFGLIFPLASFPVFNPVEPRPSMDQVIVVFGMFNDQGIISDTKSAVSMVDITTGHKGSGFIVLATKKARKE